MALDLKSYIIGKQNGSGGGSSNITLKTLTVTENGTKNAPSGKAYNKVVTNVRPTYSVTATTLFISGMVESGVLSL